MFIFYYADSSKGLDPSCMMDLDFGDYFERTITPVL